MHVSITQSGSTICSAPSSPISFSASRHSVFTFFDRFGLLDAIGSEGPMRSVKQSLPNSEPMVLKCICPADKVSFYCPVHGRVENPNWRLLYSIQLKH